MKRSALILLLTCSGAPFAWCAPPLNPVNELQKQAQAAITGRRFDDALHLYERIIVEHPEVSESWFSIQWNILDTLLKEGDLAEAAKAAHLCLDSAPDLQAYNNTVALTANILSALDKNVDRANQFLAFQQSGATGGVANPMDAVGYPALPGRESAFAVMRQQAGDSVAASQLRARTFLLTGKPKEALAQFADAFRRSYYHGIYSSNDLQRTAPDLAVIGLRAVRGASAGLEKAVQFILFGPNGPDGKPSTADDLADPFAQWLPPLPAPGEGGLAGLTPDDLTALRRVRDGAKLYVRDPWVNGNLRLRALLALQRTMEALDDWGEPGLKAWYLQIVLVKWADDNDLNEGLLAGAQAAARGGALHLGGVHLLRKEIDARCAALGIKPTNGMTHIEAGFNAVCAALNKIPFPKPAWKPLKTPASF